MKNHDISRYVLRMGCEYCNGEGHMYEGDLIIATCSECNGTGEDYDEDEW